VSHHYHSFDHFFFLLSQNASPSIHQQGRNIWATAGLAVAVLLAVTGYSC